MKKIAVLAILAVFCLTAPNAIASFDEMMEIGIKVVIVKDIRDVVYKLDGQVATFIGWHEKEGYILFNENGTPVRESYTLPDGYVVWDSDNEDFPKQKCGIVSKNPIFITEAGEKITGGQCYWEPKDPELKQRMIKAGMELLNKAKQK